LNSLLITTDDHTFIVYDLEKRLVTYQREKDTQLDCKTIIGMDRPSFRPFGIAADDSHLYIASNNVIGKYNKSTYQFENILDISLYINTHQIVKDKNVFYTCNTAVNTIGIYDKSSKVYKQFDLNTLALTDEVKNPVNVYEYDVNHVNSLFDAGDKIWFCLHNRGLRPSEFGWIDKTTFEAKIELMAGNQCHGIEIISDTLYTLSTGSGELIQINILTKQETAYPLVDTTTFLRGLAVWDNKLVFGGSINFKHQAKNTASILGFFDLSTKTTELFDLPNINFINDLKLIDA
jgi:hypothetical protein